MNHQPIRERLYAASRRHANDAELSGLLVDAYLATEAARQLIILLESVVAAFEPITSPGENAFTAAEIGELYGAARKVAGFAHIALATPIVDVLR